MAFLLSRVVLGFASACVAENRARECDRLSRQWSSAMLQDESCEFLGWVVVAGFEPVGRDSELRCEFA